MPEAFVEEWQEFSEPKQMAYLYMSAGDYWSDRDRIRELTALQNTKTLVEFANLYEMNIIASNPIMEGRVRDIDIPSIGAPTTNTVAKHL